MSTNVYKLTDNDHPELSWQLETSPTSDEYFFFKYNFENVIKGWFSVVPKYLLKRQTIAYASLYYTKPEAEVRKVDGNFAVIELIWELIEENP